MAWGLTLEQVGILYGIVLSTVGVSWQAWAAWRSRGRLSIYIGPGMTESVDPFPGGFHQLHYLVATIKNRGEKPIAVESWGIRPTRGSGPIVLENTGLPAKLDGLEKVQLTLYDPKVLISREPDRIWVEDARGKKWYASAEVVAEALRSARQVIESNASRTTERPSRLARPAMKPTSIFAAPTPGSRTQSIFGAPPSPDSNDVS